MAEIQNIDYVALHVTNAYQNYKSSILLHRLHEALRTQTRPQLLVVHLCTTACMPLAMVRQTFAVAMSQIFQQAPDYQDRRWRARH